MSRELETTKPKPELAYQGRTNRELMQRNGIQHLDQKSWEQNVIEKEMREAEREREEAVPFVFLLPAWEINGLPRMERWP